MMGLNENIVQPNQEAIQEGAESPDRLTAWAWLGVPLVLAALLIIAPRISAEFYETWFEDEKTGLLESIHWIIPLWGSVVAGRILMMRQLGYRGFLKYWAGAAMLGCFFIAGEEANWGQHYFGWATPENWMAINAQQETNLHNVSSWLNEKPRTWFEIALVGGGIVIPLLALLRPEVRNWRWAIILPPMVCLPSALLAELSRNQERLSELLGSDFFLFYRASEVQETYFYIFILLYTDWLSRTNGMPP
jgi:hypothetical protein